MPASPGPAATSSGSKLLPGRIAVVGGGITGLSAAWRLYRQGCRVTLFEKAPVVGGSIVTHADNGWLIEGGPNTLQQTAEIAGLVDEVGLTRERVLIHPATRNRFIVRRGRVVPVPLSPAGLLVSPLFSWRARLKVISECLVRPRIRTTDVPLATFVAAHFGREVVDYALDPIVSGIFGGDPEKLSARYAFPTLWQLERQSGSLLRGFRKLAAERRARGDAAGIPPIISFTRGLQQLPAAIAAALPADAVRTGATVTSLIPGRPWKLIHTQGEAVQTEEFDAVVLALPAGALAQLVFSTLGERSLASLDHQPHPPLSSLFLGFRRDQVEHPLNGFGVLAPSCERRNFLGALFSSSLFPGRTPADHVAITVFAGGTRFPETARLPTAVLLGRILPDIGSLLGIKGEPVFVRHTFWPRAIPQYNLGHERFLEPLARVENQYPGLFIGGNFRDGIALPDCVKSGRELAKKAEAFAAKRPA